MTRYAKSYGAFASAIFAAVLTSAVALASADEVETGLAAELRAFVVTANNAGDEVFVEASVAQPGDTIEYRIQHTNNTDGNLSGFVVNGQVPTGTVFVGGSQTNPENVVFEARYDGGQWGQPPLRRVVKGEDGATKEVIVPPKEYVAVRWVRKQELVARGKSQVRYRVRVAQ